MSKKLLLFFFSLTSMQLNAAVDIFEAINNESIDQIESFDNISDIKELLHHSIKNINTETKKLEIVKYLLKKGSDINEKNSDNLTPLHFAVRYSSVEVIKYLESKGAKPSIKSDNYTFFLQLAALNKDVRVIQCIRSKMKTDINKKMTPFDNPSTTLLHIASTYNQNPAITRYLIKQGADINAQTDKKITPLFAAIEETNLAMVKVLLQLGARTDMKNNANKTTIEIIEANDQCTENEKKIAKLLVENRGNIQAILELKNEYDKDLITKEDADIMHQMILNDPEEQASNFIEKLAKLNPEKAKEYRESLSKHPSIISPPILTSSWTPARNASLTTVAISALIYDFVTFKAPKKEFGKINNNSKSQKKLASDSSQNIESQTAIAGKQNFEKKSSKWNRLTHHTKAYFTDLKNVSKHRSLALPALCCLVRLLKK